MEPVTVFGIDPSVVGCGLVTLRCAKDWDVAEVLQEEEVDPGDLTGFKRALYVADRAIEVYSRHSPGIVVIEGYAFGNKYSLATLVEVGTLLRYRFNEIGITPWTLSPISVKKIASGKSKGAGKVKKAGIIKAVKAWGHDPLTHNTADGYVLAMAGLMWKRAHPGGEILAAQRDALNGLAKAF